MHSQTLHIKMLGSLELERQGRIITDGDNRSKKIWLLLALLAYNRNNKVSQEKILSYFWNDFEGSSNPQNALKTLFHRLRVSLSPLGDDVSQKLFQCKKGDYFLNPDFPYELDIDRFESLIMSAREETDKSKRVGLLRQAFNLYHGDFLMKFSSESWIIPISTYYHNLFLETVEELVDVYEAENDYQTAIEILEKANSVEQYEESFYLHLMQNLISLGRMEDVTLVYKQLSDMLQMNFGVKPSPEVKKLYQQANLACKEDLLDSSSIQKQLLEDGQNQRGALYCDYDFFLNIYHAMARGLERNGNVVHLVIMTITDLNNHALSKRSLDVCVTNLKALSCETLRQGDVVSMCSPSQFVILLPNANRENALMVSHRIEKSFLRKYPHSPAKLNFDVQPLLPPEMDYKK
ncbi:DNA-binding transcriptional activator of the SARP family [Lachnospiraceae bacterium XBB1006]|nr:DNA-binding transcriptional activator of the SARP family [Lachnospiraceae bacterium XBB1006]